MFIEVLTFTNLMFRISGYYESFGQAAIAAKWRFTKTTSWDLDLIIEQLQHDLIEQKAYCNTFTEQDKQSSAENYSIARYRCNLLTRLLQDVNLVKQSYGNIIDKYKMIVKGISIAKIFNENLVSLYNEIDVHRLHLIYLKINKKTIIWLRKLHEESQIDFLLKNIGLTEIPAIFAAASSMTELERGLIKDGIEKGWLKLHYKA